MKYLSQFLIILGFTLTGEALQRIIPLPIPASIYGMVLLFAALSLKLVPLKAVEEAGGFLTSILPVLFIAPAVGLMDHWALFRDALVPILIIVVLSTLITFAVSGWVSQWFIRRKGGKQDA
jgi:holin-like protein